MQRCLRFNPPVPILRSRSLLPSPAAALGYDSRWRPEGFEPPCTGSSARRPSDRPRRPPTASEDHDASGDSEQSRARGPTLAGRKKASGAAPYGSDRAKRMRVQPVAGATASPFAAAASAGGPGGVVIVVVPDGACPTASVSAALAAAASGGAFPRADSLEAAACQSGAQQPRLLTHQSSGGSTMEAAARAALAALGWGAGGPSTSATSSPRGMLQPHTPASPPFGPLAPTAGHSYGYFHPQQLMQQQQQQQQQRQQQQAVTAVHSYGSMTSGAQPLHPLAMQQPMQQAIQQPMQQPANEFPGQRQPSFQAWAQQPQLAAPAGGAAAHLQRRSSAPEELPQGAFNFSFGGPGAMFAPPGAAQQCAPPALSLARTYTAPSQLPVPAMRPAAAAAVQPVNGEAALHSPFAAVPGSPPGFDAASATATAPASPRAASLPAGMVERRVSAPLPAAAGASESPFAAAASLPLPPAQPAQAASPSPPPPAPAAQAPACEGSLLSLGVGDWPSLFVDGDAVAPGDSADLQQLYTMWQDGRMSMGF